MAKKVTIDNFSKVVEDILAEYENDVDGNLRDITERIGKEGVKMLKNAATVYGGKKYRKSWKAQVERGRLESTVTIYSSMPFLPHILEYGHAKRTGGRVEGRPHIKPVEEKLVSEFEKNVEAAL